jgi:predicted transcriptional regulator
MNSGKLSVYQLSKRSGVPTSTLYALLNERKPTLSLENMVKVAIALDIDLNELKEIYGEK